MKNYGDTVEYLQKLCGCLNDDYNRRTAGHETYSPDQLTASIASANHHLSKLCGCIAKNPERWELVTLDNWQRIPVGTIIKITSPAGEGTSSVQSFQPETNLQLLTPDYGLFTYISGKWESSQYGPVEIKYKVA